MTISQKIFDIMVKKHLKQSDLASYVGVACSSVTDWKKRGSIPPADKIIKISEFLDVTPEYLLGLTDEPNRYNSINNFDTTVSGTQISGNHTTINNKSISSEDAELLNLIKNLSLVERSKVVLFIEEMKNKEV